MPGWAFGQAPRPVAYRWGALFGRERLFPLLGGTAAHLVG